MPPDISLLFTRPTARRTSATDRVDLFIPAPHGGSYSIALYVQQQYADAIIEAINQRDQLLDLLSDLLDDEPNALAAATSYLATHQSPEYHIYNLLSRDPITPAELARQIGLPPSRVTAALATLELQGRARQVTGTQYIRRP